MKNLANYISASRIVLSVMLVFTKPLSLIFFVIFIMCGISDFLDGFIARHYSFTSDFGAKLDSIADAVFFLSYLIVLLPVLSRDYLIFLWIAVIALIKIISIVLGFVKYGKLALVHTYLNKITGACLVLLPFLLLLTSSNAILPIICLVATLAAIEELMIVIKSQRPVFDCASIFAL